MDRVSLCIFGFLLAVAVAFPYHETENKIAVGEMDLNAQPETADNLTLSEIEKYITKLVENAAKKLIHELRQEITTYTKMASGASAITEGATNTGGLGQDIPNLDNGNDTQLDRHMETLDAGVTTTEAARVPLINSSWLASNISMLDVENVAQEEKNVGSLAATQISSNITTLDSDSTESSYSFFDDSHLSAISVTLTLIVFCLIGFVQGYFKYQASRKDKAAEKIRKSEVKNDQDAKADKNMENTTTV